MDVVTLVLARKYTDSAIAGTGGAIKGKSAYEIAIQYGYAGTEAQFAQDTLAHNAFIISPSTAPATPVGNWAVWDPIARQYIDSGIIAIGKKGVDGKDGKDGKDGITPEIGANGNWWVNGSDTGVPALSKYVPESFIADGNTQDFELGLTPTAILYIYVKSSTSLSILDDSDYSVLGRVVSISDSLEKNSVVKVLYVTGSTGISQDYTTSEDVSNAISVVKAEIDEQISQLENIAITEDDEVVLDGGSA